ncbi:MAG: NAD(P)-dependent oxidoreductase [Defluviitaleaceae bacterium]|nr:NAD(P)-dependent oxidoreductase [Defluviitaleaceae bacterium]
MKTLVTGSTGRFGPHLVRELLSHGHEVSLFSRSKPREEFKCLEWIQGSINNIEDCLQAMKGRNFDAIHNLAALADPTDSPGMDGYNDPSFFPLTMQTNIMGLYNMLQAALRNDIGIFVHTGSNCVLGHGYRITNRPYEIKYLPIDEEHPFDTEDSYSFSKVIGEQMLELYSKVYGMRCYSLRSVSITDAELIKKNGGKSVEPTTAWDDWLYAWVDPRDLASAHRLLMEKAHSIVPFGCYYCLGDDTGTTMPTMDIIKAYRPDLIPLIREPLEGHAPFFSNKRLKAVVGWQPVGRWR